MLKKIRNILIATIILAVAYWAYVNFVVSDNATNPFNLIPNDAVYVMHSKKPLKAWDEFSSTDLWEHMKGYPDFAEIAESANNMDEIIKKNKFILKLVSLKDFYVSAHVHKPGDYEFLFLTDLANASKSDLFKGNLDQLFSIAGYKVSTQKYLGTPVYKCLNVEENETLYVSVLGNYLSCSYDLGILKKSIASYNEPVLAKNTRFINIFNKTDQDGLSQVYLNYNNLTSFLKVYLAEVNLSLMELINQSYFTSLNLELEGDDISAEGITMVNDTMENIFNVLSNSGNSEMKIPEVLSENTSMMLRLGFKNFNTFFEQSLNITNQEEVKKSNRNIKLIELLLGVSLQDDLLIWFGNEIALAQYAQDENNTAPSKNLIAIKVNDIDLAQSKLEGVFKKIRRRMPFKMKGEEYEGYDIKRMETKGLFRLLFGKLFDKADRPYFTFVEDYVIFCDDLSKIKQTIDDYESGAVLDKQASFTKVKDDLDSKNCFTAYVNPKLYFNSFRTTLNAQSFTEFQKNKQYVTCFNGFGLSLKTQKNGEFKTKIRNNFIKP